MIRLNRIGTGVRIGEHGRHGEAYYEVVNDGAALVTLNGSPYRAARITVNDDDPSDVWVFFVRQTRTGRDYVRGNGTWWTIEHSLRPFGYDAIADEITAALAEADNWGVNPETGLPWPSERPESTVRADDVANVRTSVLTLCEQAFRQGQTDTADALRYVIRDLVEAEATARREQDRPLADGPRSFALESGMVVEIDEPTSAEQAGEIIALVIPTEGPVRTERLPNDDGTALRNLVGGWLEMILGGARDWRGWVNEEGKLGPHVPNMRATLVARALGWSAGSDYVAGTLVLTGVRGEDIASFPADLVECVRKLLKLDGPL